jgi:hypothetical protein
LRCAVQENPPCKELTSLPTRLGWVRFERLHSSRNAMRNASFPREFHTR